VKWSSYLLFVLGCMLVPGSPRAEQAPESVKIGRSFTLDSAVLHEQRRYTVHLPDSYSLPGSEQRRYPVLYMLDGENFFLTATGVVDFMSEGSNGNYAIPEMIVVGVENTNRTRDLTPSHIVHGKGGIGDWSASGRSEAFFSFLDKELLPQIDRNYRTTPYRILAGHSLAGLAAVDAFQEHPAMFQAEIAIDPSMWWDDEVMLRKTQEKPPVDDSRSRLYIALANTPSIDGPFAGIAAVHISAIRSYAAFMTADKAMDGRFKLSYFPSEEHGSVPLLALYDGLSFVFDHYKLTFAAGLNHPDQISIHFDEVSKNLGAPFPPPERLVNVLGYMALNDLKDTAKAVTLFSLNTRYYPTSANAYDSLGEAYAASGQNGKAIASYRRSMELNPGNGNAKAWLTKLEAPGR
jgi:predicted alpha/beta superfamily hydrolase